MCQQSLSLLLSKEQEISVSIMSTNISPLDQPQNKISVQKKFSFDDVTKGKSGPRLAGKRNQSINTNHFELELFLWWYSSITLFWTFKLASSLCIHLGQLVFLQSKVLCQFFSIFGCSSTILQLQYLDQGVKCYQEHTTWHDIATILHIQEE